MFIPPETIELIRDRSNIEEISKRYIPTLKKKGKKFIGLCPFHKEKTPSFTISPEKQIFYCFGCQTGGNIFSFITKIEKIEFIESVKLLAGFAGIEIKADEKGKSSKINEYFRLNAYTEKFYHKFIKSKDGAKGFEYLVNRKVSKESIDDFKLGFSKNSWNLLTNSLKKNMINLSSAEEIGLLNSNIKNNNKHYYDRFRNRVIFPIHDERNKIVGFGGRSVDNEIPKYINSPESEIFKKREILYGLNIAKEYIQEFKRVIIVEGYLDMIGLYQAGIKNVVAPLGTSLTINQIKLLSRYSNEIIILFDADSAGINSSLKALNHGDEINSEIKIARLPKGDPFDFVNEEGTKELMRIIDSAVNPTDFKITYIINEYKKFGLIKTLKELFTVIKTIEYETEKSIYLKKISSILNIDENLVRSDYKNFLKNGNIIDKNKQNTNQEKSDNIITKAYSDLIKLICNNPELIEKLTVDFSLDDITDKVTKRIFEKIIDIYISGKKFSIDKIFDFLNDDIEMDFLNKLLIDEYEVDDPENTYKQIYIKLEVLKIEKKIKKIADLIKTSTGNTDDLFIEMDILRREKEKLSSFVYNQN